MKQDNTPPQKPNYYVLYHPRVAQVIRNFTKNRRWNHYKQIHRIGS